MKSYVLTAVLFVACLFNGCGNQKNIANNNDINASSTNSTVKTEDTPLPINPSAKIENGQIINFKGFTTVLPKDWTRMADFLYRSPSYNSDDHQFANFLIVKDDTKTEFTELSPDEALKRFKERKTNEPNQPLSNKIQYLKVDSVKVQPLTIDGIAGIYSETDYLPESSGIKEFNWTWTTFSHSKDKSYEIRIDLGGNSKVKEQCKPIFDAMINSLKIKRLPDETFPAPEP